MQTRIIKKNTKWIETHEAEPEPEVMVMATWDYKKEFQAMICHGGQWFHKTNTIATPLAWRVAA